jgi:hypothetical protein
MKRITIGSFAVAALAVVGLRGVSYLEACTRAEGAPKESPRVMIVGSGTIVDGIFTPLEDAISSQAQASFEAQDHGSGKALQTATAPALQPAIAVRSSRARDDDFVAANLATPFRCAVAIALAYDSIAFWVRQDHPIGAIELAKLRELLFQRTVDDALPTWEWAGVPATSNWAGRKIAILMPRGPRDGGEDSGTRREAERLLSGGDDQRFSLQGQWKRNSEDIARIPYDVETNTTDDVAPIGLASAAFVGNAKVRPLAIYDAASHRNFDFGVRPLWAYVLVPRTGPVPDAVVRILRAVLSDALQTSLEDRHFRRITEGLLARERAMLDAAGRGDCSGGRAVGGMTIVEPPQALLDDKEQSGK